MREDGAPTARFVERVSKRSGIYHSASGAAHGACKRSEPHTVGDLPRACRRARPSSTALHRNRENNHTDSQAVRGYAKEAGQVTAAYAQQKDANVSILRRAPCRVLQPQSLADRQGNYTVTLIPGDGKS